ncbi:T9SS type A sorting domain-containing protein [Rufibacter psychrotolerans]|uniref:T9SS type A sorting domain-containing protein n=1 Tax=Rufibacter psychrotolerans TaxID=2812556 RepID=UPI0019685465|nr:T9SS type A sorting domain-containing protein [Rufibacter sp. SYSU D00308]
MNWTPTPKLIRLFIFFLLLFVLPWAQAQQRVKKTIFQAYWWDYWNSNFPNGWANYLTELAPRLKAAGFDAVWIPPVYKNASTGSVGYSPFDVYDLGDKFQKGGDGVTVRTRVGSKDELLRMIAVMHANGIEVIQDVVLNHNDGAGANNGAGGQDPAEMSMRSNGGYKNFRFTSYATPLIDDSQDDYWTRSGRWAKNYPNFHPNQFNNTIEGDLYNPLFGPDISYQHQAYGQSSNIPTLGSATLGNVIRPYYNPAQRENYMRDKGREWIMWFKKQTGSDGWRWDAVKHFPIEVQEDYIYNTKYLLPAWVKGGEDMFNVGEWIGDKGAIDNYVNAVKSGNEKHTGTFDFALRGYGPNGGLYSMVLGNGGYNMQAIPGEQQGERYHDYGGKRVYRTVPFVNSHDTFRPKLQGNGNFQGNLGEEGGWNIGDEVGGNGKHLDPREPRLAAAYAVAVAVDGNPSFYFEDFFDVGTTGKRWSHDPTNTADLPTRTDLLNLLQAHQKLGFKDGEYAVPTDSGNPHYGKGHAGDHLVIERKGKAIIGITDAYASVGDNSQDQEVYVTVDPSWNGKLLYDYSGAHGISTTEVYNDSRVLIKTAPVGHVIAGARGHGYSIWAPAPAGVTFNSVQDIYNYLATYAPPRNRETTQEWEMADDLGDSHCQSLGQGGRLPDNSTNQRVAGKIFVEAGKPVIVKVYPEFNDRNVTVSLWNLQGSRVGEAAGVSTSSAPVTLNYAPAATGWLVMKVRNSTATQWGQKVWVNATYTAPATLDTRSADAEASTRVAIWTGNKGTTDVTDCGNWEEGKSPDQNTNVVIPAYSSPSPIIAADLVVKSFIVEEGASVTLQNASLKVFGALQNSGTIDAQNGKVELLGTEPQMIAANTFLGNTIRDLTIGNAAGVSLGGALALTGQLTVNTGTLSTNGHLVLKSEEGTSAIVAPVASGGNVVGNVLVERFIPANNNQAYRLLGASVTGGTLYDTWQNGGANVPGLGMHITGGAGQSTSQGFDAIGEASVYTFNVAKQTWEPVPNTNAMTLSVSQGYLAYVRGDRKQENLTSGASSNTKLTATGPLVVGDYSFAGLESSGGEVGSQRLSLVTNPYVAPLDWAAAHGSNSASFEDYYTYMEPKAGEKGAFVSVKADGTKSISADFLGGAGQDNIQMGQAFLLRTKRTVTSPSFSLQESHKVSAASEGPPAENTPQRFNMALFAAPADGGKVLDGAVAYFSDRNDAAVGSDDALKVANLQENLSILRSKTNLSIEGRPALSAKVDTLPLRLFQLPSNNYVLKFQAENLSPALQITLVDKLTGSVTPIGVEEVTSVPFTVTDGPASSLESRFMVLLNPGTLPVTIAKVKAYQKEQVVQIEWMVYSESEMDRYEVERSADGRNFEVVGEVSARAGTNNDAYTYRLLDRKPHNGSNYYRVKSIENSGHFKYSKTVYAKFDNLREIKLYPNPVKGGNLTLHMNSQLAGAYSIRLFNGLGQEVFAQDVLHEGGSDVYRLQFGGALTKGVYYLHISSGDTRTVRKLLVE